MKQHKQMSDTLFLGMLLAISGGFMDAYSYICRDHAFANAQTGNILLLGVNLAQRNFADALHYFFPVFAFVAGIVISELARNKYSCKSFLHWRQITVLVEAILLLIVAFIPQGYSSLANSLTSLACGIQVESFRTIEGNSVATTMCIGNLRSGTQYLCDYFSKKDRAFLKKSMLYYGAILCFVFGAIIGNIAILRFHTYSIIFCSVILVLVFFIMFFKFPVKKDET